MIDHLISFPTEADALAHPALARWVSDDGESGPQWNRSACFPGLTLVVVPAAYDEDGNQTQAQQNFPGWWMVVSTSGDEPDPELAAIEPCRMIAHREWGAAGLPFVFQEGLRADPQQIAQITRIDGLPAGSAYPISQPRVIE